MLEEISIMFYMTHRSQNTEQSGGQTVSAKYSLQLLFASLEVQVLHPEYTLDRLQGRLFVSELCRPAGFHTS